MNTQFVSQLDAGPTCHLSHTGLQIIGLTFDERICNTCAAPKAQTNPIAEIQEVMPTLDLPVNRGTSMASHTQRLTKGTGDLAQVQESRIVIPGETVNSVRLQSYHFEYSSLGIEAPQQVVHRGGLECSDKNQF